MNKVPRRSHIQHSSCPKTSYSLLKFSRTNLNSHYLLISFGTVNSEVDSIGEFKSIDEKNFTSLVVEIMILSCPLFGHEQSGCLLRMAHDRQLIDDHLISKSLAY